MRRVMIIAIWVLIIKFNQSATILLKVINVTLITLILWMIIEGFMHIRKKMNV